MLALLLLGACAAPNEFTHAAAILPSTSAPPPAWMSGVWTREWIARRGVRSSPSAVRYLQTPNHFADIRVPYSRAAIAHARSFADLTDAELELLADQRGFTGPASAVGDIVTWAHEIEFQPPDGEPDVGRVQRRGPTQMLEHALDRSYVESWRTIAPAESAFLVIRVERLGRLHQVLVVVGDHFLYVRNRDADLPMAASMRTLIATSGASRAQVIAYLDCEFSSGRVRGGREPWQIQLSTLPWREGKALTFTGTVSVAPDSTTIRVAVDSASHWSVALNTLSKVTLASYFPTPR